MKNSNHNGLLERTMLARRRVTASGCWEWTGKKNGPDGYGYLLFDGKALTVHRLSWECFGGNKIQDGLLVLHKCDNPPCFNPDHLFTGTQKDNLEDAARKHRMQHGAEHYRSKLTDSKVLRIRKLWGLRRKLRLTLQKIANRFGVTRQNVSLIVNGKTWRHLGQTNSMTANSGGTL